MGIQDKGLGTNRTLESILTQLEQRQKTLGEIATPPAETPKSAKEVRQRAVALDQQIDAVTPYTQSADPAAKAAAQKLTHALKMERLELEDPVLAEYISRLHAKYATQIPQVEGGAAPPDGPYLKDEELLTVLALVGDRVSAAEAHALFLLRPLMSAEQVRDNYQPLMQASYHTEQAKQTVMSLQTLKIAGTSLVYFAPVLTSAALGLMDAVAGPVATAMALSGSVIGSQLGGALARDITASASDFGVNRVEGVKVDHDLVRLLSRAGDQELFTGSPDKIRRQIRIEVALIRELLSTRQPSNPNATGIEGRALRAFESYAADLEAAGQARGGIQSAADFARQKLARTITEDELKRLPSTTAKLAGPPGADVLEPLALVLREHNRMTLSVENPSLLRLVHYLEGKYDVDARLDARRAGKTPPPLAMTRAEIEALRMTAGHSASLAEYVALRPFEQAGVLKLADLWGADFSVNTPQGQKLQSAGLAALDGFGDRASGASMETAGKVIPWVGTGIATVVPASLILLLPGVGIPLAIGVAILSRVGGKMLGAKLSSDGKTTRAMAGVEAAEGKPVHSEYALLLERYARPEALLRGTPAEVKERLLTEAELIDTYYHTLEAWPLGASNESIFIYEQFATFAKDLRRIAESDLAPPARLQALVDARSKVFEPKVGYNALLDVMSMLAVSDQPELFRQYCKARLDLLRDASDLSSHLSEQADAKIRNATLHRQALAVVSGRKTMPKEYRNKVEEDEVDRLADQIVKSPYDTIDRPALGRVTNRKDALEATTRANWRTLGAIDEERAGEIGQEILNALWTQVYPLFGSVPGGWDEYRPELTDIQAVKGKKAVTDPATGTTSQETVFNVTASVKPPRDGWPWRASNEGGKFSATIYATGVPDTTSIELNLGERFLGLMAQSTLRNHLNLTTSGHPWLSDPERRDGSLVRAEAEAQGVSNPYVFRIEAEGTPYRVGMTPDGFALLDTVKRI